ncbi:MAG: hypothetical protein J6Z31_07060 [Fibrobacter sp.]|nr:hypothetical protein [Fibrobacter sp.]
MGLNENFARWYDDDGFTFHVETRIPFTQCGPDGKMSLFDFLRLTTDISTEDVRLRGTSMGFLASHNIARVVARNSFRFHRMPTIDERIEVVTAESKAESFQFNRHYQVFDSEKNLLISGSSKWMITSFDTRKILPTKTIESFRKLNPEVLPKPDCLPCGKILEPEKMEKIGEQTIRRSNLDGNNHTDNAFYAAFVMSFLPDEYASKPLIDFRINYSKEALYGETLELFMAKSAENRVIVTGKKQDGISFVSELTF